MNDIVINTAEEARAALTDVIGHLAEIYTGRVMKLAADAGTIADLDEYGIVDREVPSRLPTS